MIDILLFLKTHFNSLILITSVIIIISSTILHIKDSNFCLLIGGVSLLLFFITIASFFFTHTEILKEEKTINGRTYLEIVQIDRKDINYKIYDNNKNMKDIPNDIQKSFIEHILAHKKDKPVLSTKFDNFDYIILYSDGEQQTFKLSDIQDDRIKQYALLKNFHSN